MIRFSPTTKAFYPYEIDYHDLPNDIVDVPIQDFEAVLAKSSDAKRVFKDGKVQAIERPAGNYQWNEAAEEWQQINDETTAGDMASDEKPNLDETAKTTGNK